MQNQHKPVLILAQSGRFLAQSATQAGYTAWVADCFGDQDTLSHATRWHALPPLSELTQDSLLNTLNQLTNGEKCTLICGSGIEHYFNLLSALPDTIHLVGNAVRTIEIIKTPEVFFSLLTQSNLPYPDTQFKQPTDNKGWLIKSATGLGGHHIQHLNRNTHTTGCYYQRLITGNSGSALFLANGSKAQLVSINQQTIIPNAATPFRLGDITTPWVISDKHQQKLKEAICKITLKTGLLGLNSLDFIISEQDELLLLEINPRPSASAELIDSKLPLFQHHINACRGVLPDIPVCNTVTHHSLHYLYAPHDCRIPSDMVWPPECHDLPTAETLIKKNAPLCTSIVNSENTDHTCHLHNDIEKKVLQQLLN